MYILRLSENQQSITSVQTKQLFLEFVMFVTKNIGYKFMPLPKVYSQREKPSKESKKNISKSRIQLMFVSLRLISPATAAMHRGS